MSEPHDRPGGPASVAESSPLATFRLDPEGRVTFWNGAAERLFGWSRQEVLGRPLPNIPPDRKGGYSALLSGKEGDGGVEIECVTKSGERLVVSAFASALKNERGEIEGVVGTMLDVAGAGRDLARKDRRLGQVFEQSVDALFVHDEGGRILDCNLQACLSLGYSREELLGMYIRDLTSIAPSAPSGGRSFLLGRQRRKDGTTFLAEVRFGPIEYEGRTLVLTSARDVTEREEALWELGRLERRYEMILDSAGEGIYGVDRRMRITFANPAAARMTGWKVEDLVGRDSHETFHRAGTRRESHSLQDCPVLDTLRSGRTRRSAREVLFRKNGTTFPAEYSSNPMKEGEEVSGAVVVFRDITEKRRAERLSKEREERFRVLFQNASDVIVISDSERNVRYASPSAEKVLGYKPEELVGTPALRYVHPEDREKVGRAMSEARKRRGVSPPVESRWQHAGGAWRVCEVIASNLLHEPTVRGLVFNIRDVTERKVLEDQLAHQAFHDSLTDLPNRELFTDRLDQAIKRSRRTRQALAVLFLDLDNFKFVNDSLGHEFGDRLLAEVSRRIRLCLRETDTAARFGGDEFTILLEDVGGEEDAVVVAQRIREELREPFVLGGREVFVTTSIGISLNTFGTEHPEDLLRHADIAVYHAKERGRNGHAVFEPAMNAWALEQMVLGNDLKRALEREELVLLYLPKVSLSTGRVSGVEALLYWDHPERGRLGPREFVPLAEETGMIIPIGRWVLLTACCQMNLWLSALSDPPKSVSVNLSVVQLRSRNLVEDVREILEESGLGPGRLFIEVAESLLTEDVYSLAETLDGLRDLGVGLAVDDFGTGRSSLSTLKNLPLDALKVDKTFVDGIQHAQKDADIVRAVVDLAHTLGLQVVAEGVETAEQLALLRRMGCETAQGYHFSRPVAADAVASLFESSSRW